MAIESKESLVQLQPGDRFGDCTVCGLIGRGSMGAVYLSRRQTERNTP